MLFNDGNEIILQDRRFTKLLTYITSLILTFEKPDKVFEGFCVKYKLPPVGKKVLMWFTLEASFDNKYVMLKLENKLFIFQFTSNSRRKSIIEIKLSNISGFLR